MMPPPEVNAVFALLARVMKPCDQPMGSDVLAMLRYDCISERRVPPVEPKRVP